MKNNLEDRLISFSVSAINLAGTLKSETGRILFGQLVKSSTSVSLNYGEARSAESKRDFIHKMKIVLKELRETNMCLRIISQADLTSAQDLNKQVLNESDELISIFVKSIQTAQSR